MLFIKFLNALVNFHAIARFSCSKEGKLVIHFTSAFPVSDVKLEEGVDYKGTPFDFHKSVRYIRDQINNYNTNKPHRVIELPKSLLWVKEEKVKPIPVSKAKVESYNPELLAKKVVNAILASTG